VEVSLGWGVIVAVWVGDRLGVVDGVKVPGEIATAGSVPADENLISPGSSLPTARFAKPGFVYNRAVPNENNTRRPMAHK